MTEPRYQVQEDLPDDYLLALGIYVQTCARIELWAARLVCLTEGLEPRSPEFTKRTDKLRQFTKPLAEKLKSALDTVSSDENVKSELSELGQQILTSLDDRHRAVHGVHFIHEGRLVIEAGTKRNSERLKIAAYDPALIQAAITNADRVLRLLKEYCETYR
ncbi:hypothetical protein [Thioclava sp. F36-6]|uniref:hypothetical protein n=1 Tax=Thioclava sp. F36-6 TaxID=1915316 RepID=UPI000996E5DE|nr:hypothetical protein [Thioclava sp. F36-6]OOY32901.1 hypothetical protein BMI88_03260 [Thioclava sp. F36-6]